MKDKGKGKSKALEKVPKTQRPAAKKQKTLPARQPTAIPARDEGGPGPVAQAFRAGRVAAGATSENTTTSPPGSAANGQPHCCTHDEEERKAQTDTKSSASLSLRWGVSATDSDNRKGPSYPKVNANCSLIPCACNKHNFDSSIRIGTCIPDQSSNSPSSGFVVSGLRRSSARRDARILPPLTFLERRRLIRGGNERQLAEHRGRARQLAALICRNKALNNQIRRNRLIRLAQLLTPPPEAAPTPIAPGGVANTQSTSSIPSSALAPIAQNETPIASPLPFGFWRRWVAKRRRHNARMDQLRRERLIGHGRLLTPPRETAATVIAPPPTAAPTTPVEAPEPETETECSPAISLTGSPTMILTATRVRPQEAQLRT